MSNNSTNNKNINLSLLGDRILVKRTKKTEKKVSNGIILPDTVNNDNNAPYIGEVVSAVKTYYPSREATKELDMPVKAGDKVLVPVFGGVKINNDLMNDTDKNNEYYLFSINEVFGIIK